MPTTESTYDDGYRAGLQRARDHVVAPLRKVMREWEQQVVDYRSAGAGHDPAKAELVVRHLQDVQGILTGGSPRAPKKEDRMPENGTPVPADEGPMHQACEGCNADAGELCRPWCTGQAEYREGLETKSEL